MREQLKCAKCGEVLGEYVGRLMVIGYIEATYLVTAPVTATCDCGTKTTWFGEDGHGGEEAELRKEALR